MNVTCDNCNSKFAIPDHMIPRGNNSILKCPKCKKPIPIPTVTKQKQIFAHQTKTSPSSFGKQLNALICINTGELEKKVVSAVRQMGLNAEIVTSIPAALKKLEYHVYHLVVVDDAFDQNKGISGILNQMNSMDMSLRRKICLVWLSNTFNTNDNLTSLHVSVNAILHQDDLLHLEPFLSQALRDHKELYTVYNESLKTAGKG